MTTTISEEISMGKEVASFFEYAASNGISNDIDHGSDVLLLLFDKTHRPGQ
jgi:hypothetical protein